MKLRSIAVENARSFLEEQKLDVDGDMSLIVGPNGGGKTNLLDILALTLKRNLMPPMYLLPHGSGGSTYYHYSDNQELGTAEVAKFSGMAHHPQTVTIAFEVTRSDLENIQRIKLLGRDGGQRDFVIQGRQTQQCADWDTALLEEGARVCYRFVNGIITENLSAASSLFYQYLRLVGAANAELELYGQEALNETVLYLPVNRAAVDMNAEVTLASVDHIQLRRNSDAMHSRQHGRISNKAIASIARTCRQLEMEHGARASAVLKQLPNMMRLTSALQALGYGWDVQCVNLSNNTYTILLEKQGSKFKLEDASSGERQLLTYLLVIYSLNIRDALVIIDEPELHLHPRWQKSLLNMFEMLCGDTGNQFVMATHSPTFISPASIKYVSRVYSNRQRSRIVRMNQHKLPRQKHQLDVINSHNNERIFFADLVVLVEGPSDKMVVERLLLARQSKNDSGGATVEVVAVHGKTMFPHYASILQAIKVRWVIIADFDYLHEVGDDNVKALFSVSSKKIKRALQDPSSTDGDRIVRILDEIVSSGPTPELADGWEAIKARRASLGYNLSSQQVAMINSFIASKRLECVFILSKGALEKYLPDGYSRKNMDTLIELVASDDFEDRLPVPNSNELFDIVEAIEEMRCELGASPRRTGVSVKSRPTK